MSSRDTLAQRRPWLIARLAWSDYRVVYSARVLALSVLSRALLQVVFFTLIGRTAAGVTGQTFAFLGSLALICASPGIIQVPDVIVEDKWQRTLYQLRLGQLPLLAVMVLRSWVHIVQGLALSLIALGVLAPVFVGTRGQRDILAVWPALVVAAAASACVGMAVGAASLGKRSDVFLANGMFYAVVLLSGAIAPLTGYPVLRAIGSVLPVQHTLLFMRASPRGSPPWQQLWLEAAVGAGWLVVAALLLRVQSYRARQLGFDEFE